MRIDIKGPIINDAHQRYYDYFNIPATSPNLVNKAIMKAQKGEELEVYVNSGGGSVFAGSEIYSSLRDYDGDVTGKIVGVAASAASVAVMGCNKILMSPPAQIMIHNSATGTQGDKNTMGSTGEALQSIDESIANAYMDKTKMGRDELLELMNKTTWLNLEKAKKLGFVDGNMFDENIDFVNSYTNNDGTLPPEVIEKLKNVMMADGVIPEIVNEGEKQEVDPEVKNQIELAKARIKLLIV